MSGGDLMLGLHLDGTFTSTLTWCESDPELRPLSAWLLTLKALQPHADAPQALLSTLASVPLSANDDTAFYEEPLEAWLGDLNFIAELVDDEQTLFVPQEPSCTLASRVCKSRA